MKKRMFYRQCPSCGGCCGYTKKNGCQYGSAEFIRTGGHNIQIGGSDGDGYCYEHQSFNCLEKLNSK